MTNGEWIELCPAHAFTTYTHRRPLTRTYLNDRHVCDGGDVGCRSRRRARSNMSILRGFPTKRCAQSAPSPPGLRPGRSSTSLPGLTISTYGLRRAPRIRSVLATTHHAPIIEIGSKRTNRIGFLSVYFRVIP